MLCIVIRTKSEGKKEERKKQGKMAADGSLTRLQRNCVLGS